MSLLAAIVANDLSGSVRSLYLFVLPLYVMAVVSSALFGFTTAVALWCIYTLVNRGFKERSIQILLLTTCALYGSTLGFFVCATVYVFMVNHLDFAVTNDLVRCNPFQSTCANSPNHSDLSSIVYKMGLAMTATLMINITISDCIVWWRALAVWGYNRIVLAVGAVLIVSTFALAVTSTAHSTPVLLKAGQVETYVQYTTFFVGDTAGLAAVVLSLVTNVLATALLSYKAWEHWLLVKDYMAEMYSTQSALGALMLLVESGGAYCIVWMLIVIVYGALHARATELTPSAVSAIYILLFFVQSSLVPVIALYPMVLIIIFAIRRSAVDKRKHLVRDVCQLNPTRGREDVLALRSCFLETDTRCSEASTHTTEERRTTQLKSQAAGPALSSTLFGAATVITVMAIYTLLRRGFQNRPVKILLAATSLLYTSTCIHFVCWISALFQSSHYIVPRINFSGPSPDSQDAGEFPASMNAMFVATIASLAVNMTVSDSIVWWRVLAVWDYQRPVWAVGAVLVVATFVTGLLSTTHSIVTTCGDIVQPIVIGFISGTAAVFLTMATNLAATSLIAFKAWQHRAFVSHLIAGTGGRSRALGALMLLAECGVVYSALWLSIGVVYAILLAQVSAGVDFFSPSRSAPLYFSTNVFVQSCLPPLVAMYPMSIVVLFTMKRSVLEQAGDHASMRLNSISSEYGINPAKSELRAAETGRISATEDASLPQTRIGSVSDKASSYSNPC
ncbi:uncharacterized protein BXZ73DRAFT_99932 [Epithele typhae]|uniref:uncharacterized protein n=1 Tax=Epithele typhae TaxID=378194 RepID=UPI002007C6DC|nr:uncharacterized protein BXZ73DRAFT_99932 [Epithele typhae]KAH9938870.1 hypothetical protein BXZ73DRAFT_99932 [Epithele typhae]